MKKRSIFLLVMVGLVLSMAPAVATTLPGQPYQRPGATRLVTEGIGGEPLENHAFDPNITPDGRYLTFFSYASNVVPGDGNNWGDVFVRDVVEGTSERVSVGTGGTESNQDSFQGTISADGRYVAFLSFATNLVTDIAKDWRYADLFVHDRQTGTTELITRSHDGAPSNGGTLAPSLSADGRYVTFMSHASNLVPADTNLVADVFVFDRDTSTIEKISTGLDGAESNAIATHPVITGNGRYVVFNSTATNLVPDDENGLRDVFLYDRTEDRMEVISVDSNEAPANDDSTTLGVDITPDGRYIAFQSRASNLVPRDTNGFETVLDAWDVFVRDREKGTTERISIGAAGQERKSSNGPSISNDGRYVAFYSRRPDAMPGDWTAPEDVWVHDRLVGTTDLISVTPAGRPGNDGSENPAITADGSRVYFSTLATDLVPDTNLTSDIALRDRGVDPGVGMLKATRTATGVRISGAATYAGAMLALRDDEMDAVSEEAGAELTGASVAFRPEEADLLFRAAVADIPSVPGNFAGNPSLIYGFQFRLDGVLYEARAGIVGPRDASAAPSFVLFRCPTICNRVIPLPGGFGTAGEEIRLSVPIAVLGGIDGLELTELGAFSGPGELNVGAISRIDEVDLGDVSLPEPTVEVALVASGGNPDPAAFTRVNVFEGRFNGTIPDALSGQSGDAIARACLGDVCGIGRSALAGHGPPSPTSSEASPSPTTPIPTISPTEVSFTDGSTTAAQYSDRATFEASLTSLGEPVAGEDLTFELTTAEGTRTFTGTTNEAGIAAVDARVVEAPGAGSLVVRFAGTDSLAGSADTTSFVVDKEDVALALEVAGKGGKRTLKAHLTDADDGTGIAGRSVSFFSDGAPIGSAPTGPDGWAHLDPPAKESGGRRIYEARFPGDDYYRDASATSAP